MPPYSKERGKRRTFQYWEEHIFLQLGEIDRVLNKSEQLFWGFIYNYNVILAY